MPVQRKPAAPSRGFVNPATGKPWRLSDPEIKAEIKAELQAMKGNRDQARQALQAIGILTPTGRLAKAYGG